MAFCWHCGSEEHTDQERIACMMRMDIDAYLDLEEMGLVDEDDEPPDCHYCRGSGLSPHSIRDVACPYCGGG